MTCNCSSAQIIKDNKKELWEIFENMDYEDTIILEIKSPDCGCDLQDTSCFDHGTRKLYKAKKTKMVEIEPYFCEEKNDIISEERKSGLEIYVIHESYHPDDKKWETNLIGEFIIFRLQFNENKHTIKIKHYEGKKDCKHFPKVTLEEEKHLFDKLLYKQTKQLFDNLYLKI